MQRLRILLVCAAVLYGALATLATGAARAQNDPAPAESAPAEPAPESQDKPHVAVLLPLKSAAFGKLAEAVKRGISAAAFAGDTEMNLPLVTYPTGDAPKEVLEAYDRALRAGARFVIGPLTKSAVQAVAASDGVTVPTLALSVPDGEVLPDRMYAVGLQIEMEARQVARVAQSQGRRRAVVIGNDSALGKRMAQAFADEWTRSGRLIVDQFPFATDAVRVKRMRDSFASNNVDAVFLALDGTRARQLRPYLPKTLPLYGTSQINTAEGSVLGQHDLNGVVFVDMPWMVLPDHPAVLAYPRQVGMFATFDQERFYALGIDAWRLSQALLETSFSQLAPLDGVTGLISPGAARQFVREPVPVQFQQGAPRLVDGVNLR